MLQAHGIRLTFQHWLMPCGRSMDARLPRVRAISLILTPHRVPQLLLSTFPVCPFLRSLEQLLSDHQVYFIDDSYANGRAYSKTSRLSVSANLHRSDSILFTIFGLGERTKKGFPNFCSVRQCAYSLSPDCLVWTRKATSSKKVAFAVQKLHDWSAF